MKNYLTTLHVDLPSAAINRDSRHVQAFTPAERCGGFGLALYDLENHLQIHLSDAYSPQNLLCFDIGFLTGSKVMTARRTYISGLSPLKTSRAGTNGVYYSAASGDFGPELRRSGLDGIRFYGRSESPVYLVVDNDEARLENAESLKERTTEEKIRMLAEKHADSAFAVIGPAAEHGVRYAGVAFSTSDQLRRGSSHMRFAGRGGFGTVMASKNLLAIVARGEGTLPEVGEVKDLNLEIGKGRKTAKYRDVGTFRANIDLLEFTRAGIHQNFSRGKDSATVSLFPDALAAQGYEFHSKGCTGCAIKCWKEIHKGGKALGKLDYEPGSLLGPNLGINNLEQIMELVQIVDQQGLDCMSAGVCIGYEMEMQRKFGDFAFARELLGAICRGEHGLKEGVFRYAPEDNQRAMHVKGIELAAYLGNVNPGYAFAIAGPHMSMDTYNRAWLKDAQNSVDEWADNIIRGFHMILYDMNGLCKFSKVDFAQVAELYSRVYGESLDEETLKMLPRTVAIRARKLDQKLGFAAADDVLPARCHEDIGSVLPHFNTREFFEEVKRKVYQMYGEMREK